MFTKPTKPNSYGDPLAIPNPPQSNPLAALAPSAEAPRKPPARTASLVAPDISIEGGIFGEGELQVDGRVKGDIRVGRLTIGETGHVEGSVQAEVVEVRGRVVGAISAKQVRLYSNSHVDGDITHEQLAMESGAFFQGRSLKFQRAAAPPPQAPGLPVAAAPVTTKEAMITPPQPQPKPA